MKAYKCDRCGKLFEKYKNQGTAEFFNITRTPCIASNCLDLCPDCNAKLQVWVANEKEQVACKSEKQEIKTNTHIVIKKEDIFKYLADNQIIDLDAILDIIASGRRKEGKKAVNSYYICNTDESYADEVLEVILKAESEED